MTDYRRLISYIYEYEGKQKGKNVGFAKLEARNGQCRINVNVKRIYMSGNAIGAYCGGLPLDAGLGYQYPALVGAPFALAGFVLLTVFHRKYERSR